MIKRKSKHIEHENSERWLVSYADFITLLFAFFVVMYATSTNNSEKQKEFEKSVREQLKMVVYQVGAGNGESTKSPTEIADSELNIKTNPLPSSASALQTALKDIQNPIESIPKSAGPKEITDFIKRRLEKVLTDKKSEAITNLNHEWYGVRMSLASSHFFQPGSYKLKLSTLDELDTILKTFDSSSRRIIVEGHTDNVPIKNQFVESNWELSSLRATSVVRYLIKYHNLNPSKVTAAAYADTKPLVPNNTEENRAKNRRIDILIISDEKLNDM